MSNYKEIKQQILNKIKEYNKIIILRHINPDGDCLGASTGLREILRDSFPNKEIYSFGKENKSSISLFPEEDASQSQEFYEDALIIVVDTATKDRIDNDFVDFGKEIIKIDHHIPVDDYGHINYVREDLPATCAIIADFYKTFSNELILSTEASKYLFTGIVTDTGRFRFRGVSQLLMELTGILLSKGLDIEKIYNSLYIKSKEELRLTSYIYSNFKITENGVAYFIVSKKVQKKFNITPETAANLVNLLEGIKGSLIWMFFIEYEDKYRVRLRSRFTNVNEIASKYKGGGHLRASGATVFSMKELKELLDDADESLKKFKEENKGVY